jgi:hypothetical protein
MSEDFKLTISGQIASAEGTITGKGGLKFEFPTSNFKLSFDYSSPEKVIIGIAGEKQIKLSADDSLVLSGRLSKNLIDNALSGSVGLQIIINKNASVKLEQVISPDGFKTTLGFSIAI